MVILNEKYQVSARVSDLQNVASLSIKRWEMIRIVDESITKRNILGIWIKWENYHRLHPSFLPNLGNSGLLRNGLTRIKGAVSRQADIKVIINQNNNMGLSWFMMWKHPAWLAINWWSFVFWLLFCLLLKRNFLWAFAKAKSFTTTFYWLISIDIRSLLNAFWWKKHDTAGGGWNQCDQSFK